MYLISFRQPQHVLISDFSVQRFHETVLLRNAFSAFYRYFRSLLRRDIQAYSPTLRYFSPPLLAPKINQDVTKNEKVSMV